MIQRLARFRSPLALAILVAAAVVLIQALLVPLFAGPAVNQAPRDLPVVVAGPPQATAGLTQQLAAKQPGAFEIRTVPDAAAAEQSLRDREAYAAFVAGADGLTLYTASAASPAVATLLTQAMTESPNGTPVRVVDVVPGDPDDPRGAGFGAGFLPLALTSVLVGVVMTLLNLGRAARLTGLLTYGVLAGLVGAAVLHGWLDVLSGTYLLNAAALGLFTLAVSATVVGLGTAIGPVGLGLGALLIFLVGNALSGVASAPEMLPQPWGTFGQWLPIGAGGTLLRSTAFFDGAGAMAPALILAGYAVVGLALTLVRKGPLLSDSVV